MLKLDCCPRSWHSQLKSRENWASQVKHTRYNDAFAWRHQFHSLLVAHVDKVSVQQTTAPRVFIQRRNVKTMTRKGQQIPLR